MDETSNERDNDDIPDELKSRYSDFKELGAGMFGQVYKAHDSALNIDVAIKILKKKKLTLDAAMRFQQEAKSASRLQHRNLVRVMDFGITGGGQPYLVMEYVAGRTLGSIVAQRKILPLHDVVHIVGEICEGIHHAHENGVVHRDLSPGNIIVAGDDLSRASIKIFDFGIAKVSETDGTACGITDPGVPIGTPYYMSPEQVSSSSIDRRSDLYSIGSLMFRMLTGRHPFEGESSLEVMQRKLKYEAPSLSDVLEGGFTDGAGSRAIDNSSLHNVEKVVDCCLRRDPEDRYSSALDLRSELLGAISEGTEYGTTELEPSRLFRRKIVLAAGAVLAILGLATLCSSPTAKKEGLEVGESERSSPAPIDLNELFKIEGTKYQVTFRREEVTDAVLMRLAGRDVTNLDLTRASITDEGCAYLVGLPLVHLNLNETKVGNEGLRHIARIDTLKELDLSRTLVSDDGMEYLIDSKNLDDLDLNTTSITDKGLETLSKKNLNRLVLSETAISDNGLKHLPPNLVGLHLDGDEALTDEGMRSIARLKNLERLYMMNTNISAKGIRYLAPMKKLIQLHMDFCKNFDDRALAATAANWPDLIDLEIPGTAVTSDGLKILPRFKKVIELNVGRLVRNDDDLKPIIEMKQLTNLHLTSCPITDKGLEQLVALPKLKKLDLLRGAKVTDEGIDKLRDGLKENGLEVNSLHHIDGNNEDYSKLLPYE